MTSPSRRASLEFCDYFKPQSWDDVFINFRLLYLPITKIITIFAQIFIRSGDNTKNTALQTMNKDIKKFLDFPTESSAQIINRKEVEVTAPDGEVFTVYCQIGALLNEETRNYELHWLEVLFDKNFSLDKEGMVQNIWREAMQFGIGNVLGISTGTRHTDRARIGVRIREIREERGMEARDLAKLAGIDAANLSRIENGKYSVGLDILAKIATALGKKVDFVDL